MPHGFRSSFRDWAAEETEYRREVIEASLAHVVGNKVEAAYARADLFERRRRLMDEWSAYLAPERDAREDPAEARSSLATHAATMGRGPGHQAAHGAAGVGTGSFPSGLDEDEGQWLWSLWKTALARFSKFPVDAHFASMGNVGVHGPGGGVRQRRVPVEGRRRRALTPSRRGRISRERPRDGCDGGTPTAPRSRRFRWGRSRHYARRYSGLGCPRGRAIGPARTALSEAPSAVATVDSGRDSSSWIGSRSGAAH